MSHLDNWARSLAKGLLRKRVALDDPVTLAATLKHVAAENYNRGLRAAERTLDDQMLATAAARVSNIPREQGE